MVLGDSEYRREIETDIEPFRGLFLGLFFITIGAGLDIDALFGQPLLIAGPGGRPDRIRRPSCSAFSACSAARLGTPGHRHRPGPRRGVRVRVVRLRRGGGAC
jgi:hypothetical protein